MFLQKGEANESFIQVAAPSNYAIALYICLHDHKNCQLGTSLH